MNPLVRWTTAAENDLRAYCARMDPAAAVADTRSWIETRLAAAFSGTPVIVLSLFVGFRSRPREAILLIDTGRGTGIVKLAEPTARLRAEYDAVTGATRVGFDGNRVFMRVSLLPADAEPVALRYQPAESAIGLPDTRPLEDVFLAAVRHGAPTPASVGQVIGDLFAVLGQECYWVGGVTRPIDLRDDVSDIGLNPSAATGHRHRLGDSLAAWATGDPLAVRQEANAAFPLTARPLMIDPVDFFRETIGELRALHGDTSAPAEARRAALVPRMLRGHAHGDLHGRNVIVGVCDNRAERPALFDYENMHTGNLQAWDFAKLETELKIRALDAAGRGRSLRRYAWDVGRFEARLAEATERHRGDGNWPDVGGDRPGRRLFTLLLAVRRAAADHLGRNRPADWLHEYYFALAAYGVFSVRYENQQLLERTAAYLTAAVAAARFAWGQRSAGGSPVPVPPARDRLWQVRQWNRAGGQDNLDRARAEAGRLTGEVPHDLHAWYELAFAQVKRKDREAALKTLQTFADRYGLDRLDEDAFCLWGRCFKDAAREALNAPFAHRQGLLKADELYQQAASYYERGFNLDGDRFPGINLATILLTRAALQRELGKTGSDDLLKRAKAVAAELIESHERGRWLTKLDDDDVWMPATLCEAYLLQGQWQDAGDAYHLAQERAAAAGAGYAAGSMRGQVEQILRAFAQLGIRPQPPFTDLDKLFPPPPA